jgi:HEPN domain-containing protein
LWLRQAEDDLRAVQVLQAAGQAAQTCFLAQQVGEKAIKALLAADDRDLRSHSLTNLLRELGAEPARALATPGQGARQALRPHPLPGCPGR